MADSFTKEWRRCVRSLNKAAVGSSWVIIRSEAKTIRKIGPERYEWKSNGRTTLVAYTDQAAYDITLALHCGRTVTQVS